MEIDPDTHLLREARFSASPNYSQRPENASIDVIVIHAISLPKGEFGHPYIEQLFLNQLDCTSRPDFNCLKDTKVSSHLLIRRDGECIQFVPFDQRAWHAGVSNFKGRDEVNDFSIGIELEGCDDQPFEAKQYEVLAAVTQALLRAYPTLSTDNICGHCDIAPERKTDPGPHFNWAYYLGLCHSKLDT